MNCKDCDRAPVFKCIIKKINLCSFHLKSYMQFFPNIKLPKKVIFTDHEPEKFNLRIRSNLKNINAVKRKILKTQKSILSTIKTLVKNKFQELDKLEKYYSNLLIEETITYSEYLNVRLMEVNCLKVSSEGIEKKLEKFFSKKFFTLSKKLKLRKKEFTQDHSGGFICGVKAADRILITGCHDSTIRGFDLIHQKQIFVLRGHASYVSCLALIPKTNFVISGSYDSSIRLWDYRQQRQIDIFNGHNNSVKALCYIKSTSQILSLGDNYELLIWNFKSKDQIKRCPYTYSFSCLCLMKDNSKVLLGADVKIILIDTRDFRMEKEFVHDKNLTCIIKTKDEKFIISGSIDKIIIWDFNAAIITLKLEGHNGNVMSLALSNDEKILGSGSNDYTVIIWDRQTGEKLNIIRHTYFVNFILRYGKDEFISLSADSEIEIIDLKNETHKIIFLTKPFKMRSEKFSDDRNFVLYGRKNCVYLKNFVSQTDKQYFKFSNGIVECVEISNDSKLAIICLTSNIENLILCNLKTNSIIGMLEGHSLAVYCASFNKDGSKVATGSLDKTVRVWNLNTFKDEYVFKEHEDFVSSIKFMNNSNSVVSAGADMKIFILDVINQNHIRVLCNHREIILKLFITDDDRYIISCNLRNGIKVSSVAENKKILSFSHKKEAKIWAKSNGLDFECIRRFVK